MLYQVCATWYNDYKEDIFDDEALAVKCACEWYQQGAHIEIHHFDGKLEDWQ